MAGGLGRDWQQYGAAAGGERPHSYCCEAAEERKTAAALAVAARTSGSRPCSPSARRQRRSWPTRPGGARRRSRRCTASRARPSASPSVGKGRAALLAGLREELSAARSAAARVTDERVQSLERRGRGHGGRRAAAARERCRRRARPGGAGAAGRARARDAAASAEERLEGLRHERAAMEAELADVAGGRRAPRRRSTGSAAPANGSRSAASRPRRCVPRWRPSSPRRRLRRAAPARRRQSSSRARTRRRRWPARLRIGATISPPGRRSRSSGSRR